VKLSDLHRPDVDSVLLECPCGGKMKRSPDVFDVWFDSAVASWATLHFPGMSSSSRMVAGGLHHRGARPDARLFYSQLGASMVSFGRAPYKSVLMHGFTLDDQGRKMSKSIGNIVQPEEVCPGSELTYCGYVLGPMHPGGSALLLGSGGEHQAHAQYLLERLSLCSALHDLDNFDARKAELSQWSGACVLRTGGFCPGSTAWPRRSQRRWKPTSCTA